MHQEGTKIILNLKGLQYTGFFFLLLYKLKYTQNIYIYECQNIATSFLGLGINRDMVCVHTCTPTTGNSIPQTDKC